MHHNTLYIIEIGWSTLFSKAERCDMQHMEIIYNWLAMVTITQLARYIRWQLII